jgi:hypothetical protein
MVILWILCIATLSSTGEAFLLPRIPSNNAPTSLFVRPEDFAAGRIQPAVPLRGTPEVEEMRRQAEISHAEAEALEQKIANRRKAERRDAEEDFYDKRYAEQYQRKQEAARREALEAQRKLEMEQVLLEEKRQQQLQQDAIMEKALLEQKEAARRQQLLLNDLEEVRQKREGYRRENGYLGEEKKDTLQPQQTNTKEDETKLSSSTSFVPSPVAKSNLPLFSLPATAILGGLLALRSRDQTQKEVEKLLQRNLVQRSNQIFGKSKNQKETEKAFEAILLQRKKEITDYGNLAVVRRFVKKTFDAIFSDTKLSFLSRQALFGISIFAELGIVVLKGSATM